MAYRTKWFGALFLGPVAAVILAKVSGRPDLWLWFVVPCSVAGFVFGRTIDRRDEARDQKGQPDTADLQAVGWQQIVRDYGAFLEQWSRGRDLGSIYDVKLLPHPKAEIERALIAGILAVKDARVRDWIDSKVEIEPLAMRNASMREWLEVGLLMLADFQEKVGTEPLSLAPGLANLLEQWDWSDETDELTDRLIKKVAMIDKEIDEERFARFQAKVKADEARYTHLIARARHALEKAESHV